MLAKEVASAVERIPTVELSTPAEESTYAIARLIMKLVDMILSWVGLGHDKTLSLVIYAALVFAISFGIGIVVQCIVVAAARYVGKHWHAELYGRMNEEHIFTKSARIIPAIIFFDTYTVHFVGKGFLGFLDDEVHMDIYRICCD